MQQRTTADGKQPPMDSLPRLSEATIRRFRSHPPSFEAMFDRLQQADPVATRWLLDVTENLAPGNPEKKEKLAALVLVFYHLLEEELVVGRFNWLHHESFDVAAEPSAGLTRMPKPR